jgi:hypothetical protein
VRPEHAVRRGGEACEAVVVNGARRRENQRDQAFVEMTAQRGLDLRAIESAAERAERFVGEFFVLGAKFRDVFHHQCFEDDARLVH